MTDLVSRLGGRSKQVDRSYREDAHENTFFLREFVDVLRVDESGAAPVEKQLVRVVPGMWVLCLEDDSLENEPYEVCRKRWDRLALFFVLEIVQKGGAPRLASGSDDADVLVLRCKPIAEIKEYLTSLPPRANATDLVVGDQPFFVPIDSLVASVSVAIGVGDPLVPSYDGLRRVSFVVINATVDLDFDGDSEPELVPLTRSTAVLEPTPDSQEFFKLHDVGIPLAKPRPRGRPRRNAVSPQPPNPTVNSSTTTPVPIAPIPVVAAATAAVIAAVAAADASADRSSSSSSLFIDVEELSEPPSPRQPPPPPSSHGKALRRLSSPQSSTSPVVENGSLEDQMCTMPAEPIDLAGDRWRVLQDYMVEYIHQLMATPSREEAMFIASPRVRKVFIDFSHAHLNGDFGRFVDRAVRESPDLVQFVARFPDNIMPIVHNVFVRPLVFQQASRVAANIQPLEDDVIDLAREFKRARKEEK
jgi:hypothetical protein